MTTLFFVRSSLVNITLASQISILGFYSNYLFKWLIRVKWGVASYSDTYDLYYVGWHLMKEEKICRWLNSWFLISIISNNIVDKLLTHIFVVYILWCFPTFYSKGSIKMMICVQNKLRNGHYWKEVEAKKSFAVRVVVKVFSGHSPTRDT